MNLTGHTNHTLSLGVLNPLNSAIELSVSVVSRARNSDSLIWDMDQKCCSYVSMVYIFYVKKVHKFLCISYYGM